MSNQTPYPTIHETTTTWLRRCDAVAARRTAEQQAEYDCAMDSRGLTDSQRTRLAKAQSQLPEDWSYLVANNNAQIVLSGPAGQEGCATRRAGSIEANVTSSSASAKLWLNRACAAVWHAQPVW